jgi:hypothetical protein
MKIHLLATDTHRQADKVFLSMWVCVGRASVASGWLIIFMRGGDESPRHDSLGNLWNLSVAIL